MSTVGVYFSIIGDLLFTSLLLVPESELLDDVLSGFDSSMSTKSAVSGN